jgi:peptidoglycan-N-acetylglucosamine deacetylase
MPAGKKCAFFYFVDVDGPDLWMGGGFQKTPLPTTVSRGVFGPQEGLPRLLDLFKEMDMKVTFAIPGHVAESFPGQCKRVVAEGHEVAHHGYHHENVSNMTREEEKAVFIKGTEALKRVLGVEPKGYDQHSADVSVHTHELLEELGFEYGMTEQASEFYPYRMRVGDVITLDGPLRWGRETKVVEIPWNWYMDDFPYFDFIFGTQTGLRDPRTVFPIYKDFFDYMYENAPGGVMHIHIHPQCSGHAHILPRMKEFLTYVKSHEDVWFPRAIDVARAYVD